ncbi:MAG: hypothetical protein MZV70_69275 [Desulfobacterales bacterium]|nr:hypothetical protein [Desulfobacterales bacterium]
MNIKRISLFLLAWLVLSAGQAAADGRKKGFIVGAGLGAGHVGYTSYWSWETWKWRQYAIAGNFKIGYAPSDSLELFVMTAGMSFRREGSADILSIVGFGLAKYFQRAGGGPFVTGGIGMSVLSRSSWDRSLETGWGGLFGLGYGFGKHLSIQGDFFVASLFRGHEKASGMRLTANYLFY